MMKAIRYESAEPTWRVSSALIGARPGRSPVPGRGRSPRTGHRPRTAP
jgi:hypothetical protein